jgi:hypothetical protein
MSQNFQAGDFLIFQIESGYGLLRILGIDGEGADRVWHLAAYNELFFDIESADASLAAPENLSFSIPHVALTHRAFEATQTARMSNLPLTANELKPLEDWQRDSTAEVSDRSIRLLIGLR